MKIACYKNKVNEFRTGIETDLSEVLQIEQVFSNVPKGQVAKKEDWVKAFGTDVLDKVVEEVRTVPASSDFRFCEKANCK